VFVCYESIFCFFVAASTDRRARMLTWHWFSERCHKSQVTSSEPGASVKLKIGH
jgi:hypothetical protein